MAATPTMGLIIKEQKVSENDRLVTILTEQLGLIRAFVPGALKLHSKHQSGTQLLCYARLSVYKGRDTYKIGDAQPSEVFFKLRQNLRALALAGYFCELLTMLAPREEPANDYLQLTLQALHRLCADTQPQPLVKSVYELKLCQFSGYMPDVSGCSVCRRADIAAPRFDVLRGTVQCENCGVKTPTCMEITAGVLAAIRYILEQTPGRAFAFRLRQPSLNRLAAVCEQFILTQTDRSYKTLDFYKTI